MSKAPREVWVVCDAQHGLPFEVEADADIALARVDSESEVVKYIRADEVERLEKLAYVGEHRFPDLTWKARCDEAAHDLRAAQQEVERLRATGQAVVERFETCRLSPAHFGAFLKALQELRAAPEGEK